MTTAGPRLELLQARIGVFARITFFLTMGFLVVMTAVNFIVFGKVNIHANTIAQFLACLVVMGIHIATRVKPLSHRTLVVLDAIGVVSLGTAFSFIAWGLPPDRRVEFVLVLASAHVLMVRAAIIPSPPRRTVVIGALASVPILVQSVILHRGQPEDPPLDGFQLGGPQIGPTFSFVYAALWIACTLIASALVSRTIYGLSTELARAKQLGQYILEHKIGEGGMGIVYRARHALLRRPTAVKLLPPEKAGEADIARFEREVRATSLLAHPNTIAVYDFGRTEDGVFYYAMEHLDGIDLDVLVRRDGPQSAARVIHILRQVCGALAEAHASGLLHRDIKPANIMLCERGGVPDVAKVLDFGLVRKLDEKTRQSTVGSITGTPLYMSPESIADPESIRAASDLYAVGAVAYFLLTGADVFQGKTVVEVCAHHLHTTPEPMAARLGKPVPADLEAVVMTCLEKSPEKRPADAQALAEMLGRCSDGNGWSDAGARTWWNDHRSLLRGAQPTTTPKSVAIDIRGLKHG